MSKTGVFILTLIIFTINSRAQRPWELGAEYLRSMGKGYNNTKVAAREEAFSNKNSFSIGITYQLASTEAFSVASGLGIYFGYRYSLNLSTNTPFAAARLLFSLENFEGKTSRNSLLITPIGELGYHMVFAKHYFVAPSIGYGYTIKFSKDYNSLNEDVGGKIIPSASAGYHFLKH